jgi:hypothetical protein
MHRNIEGMIEWSGQWILGIYDFWITEDIDHVASSLKAFISTG